MPGDVTQSPRFLGLEDLAINGAAMPEGLRFPDQLLFLRLRFLYAYARQIRMDPAQGKREKHEIVLEWERHSAEYALLCSVNDRNKNVEAAAIEIVANEQVEFATHRDDSDVRSVNQINEK